MSSQQNSSSGAVSMTASDDVVDNIKPPAGFYVGSAGSATLVFEDGSAVQHDSLIAGMLYPFKVVRVAATPAPTAGGFVAHYNYGTRP